MFYPSRQHVKWKYLKFTFNNDFMMNTEVYFNVTRNDFEYMYLSAAGDLTFKNNLLRSRYGDILLMMYYYTEIYFPE